MKSEGMITCGNPRGALHQIGTITIACSVRNASNAISDATHAASIVHFMNGDTKVAHRSSQYAPSTWFSGGAGASPAHAGGAPAPHYSIGISTPRSFATVIASA